MFILMLCAKSLFVFLYSERWIDSVPYFQILCFRGLAFCLQSVNNDSISAIGKSKTMFVFTVIKRMIGISLMVAGLIVYGMKGLLIGMVINSWFSFFVNISLVSKYIGYKWYHQLSNLLPTICMSSIIALVCYSFVNYFNLSLYLDGIIKFVVYSVLYLICSAVIKIEAYSYSKTIVGPLLKRVFKNKRN